MPCSAPRSAYRPATGGPLLFRPPENGRAYNPIKVPCGTCELCRGEQARQWAVRITHEARQWEANAFLTLTYADAKLPEHNSLNYEHLEMFWDRLRARNRRKGEKSPRYYAVGEYGDKTNRPHYHACLFGMDFVQGRIILREKPTTLWTHPELEQLWGNGNVSIGALNFATARYTASYITKKLRSKQKYVRVDEETGELIPLEQPRAFMSRNIAKNWWTEFGHQIKDHDHVVIDGNTQKPPKAYDKWLGIKDEASLEKIKEKRKEKAEKLTPEEMRARAKNAHAHRKLKGGSI